MYGRLPRQGPVVSAQSAVVMEASTGAILYEKDAHDQLYPASITKIMTTLVALEHSTMDETVTFSYDSVFSLDTGSSIIGGVNPGDTMSMKDVLYGIMICSGNEAAYAAAEHVGGSIPAFVDMMNARAQEIGCTDTHFENPHGLPNENHVTSAMDMAKITRTALENTAFKTIATTRRYTFPTTSSGEERIRLNHHKMMEGMEYAYDGCLGGKTGYTSAAGSTLVTFAQRDGMMLICVVMNEEAPSQFLDGHPSGLWLCQFPQGGYERVRSGAGQREQQLFPDPGADPECGYRPFCAAERHGGAAGQRFGG